MHVLVIPSWYPTTEAPLNGIYFVEQAQCLAERGMKVGIVYPEQQSLRRASWKALCTKYFQTEWTDEYDLPTLRRYGWNVWWRFPPGFRLRVRSAVRLAQRYAERYGVPDVIHAQSAHWAGAAASRLSDYFSIPYVLTEHFSGFQRDAVFSWRWPLIEEGYRHAHKIAAVSTSLKQALSDHDLAPLSNVEVHPNLAPTSTFFLPPSGRPPPPPFHFATVAHLNPKKNIEGLLDAVAEGIPPDSEVTLTVVGDGPNRTLLEQKARRLGIDAQVSFLGCLDRDAVRSVLWDSHAFVLPSLHETFGVVLLEAMATGLPVIATTCGGPEDIVTPDTGFLVPVNNPAALADALRAMQTKWPSFDADSIRAHTIERYGPEPFFRRSRSFYERALSE